jgi:uroporphyrin-III C-methyltransferase
LPQDQNWPALADPNATTVVFMGKRSFPALAAQLITHGLPPTTPALLAESVGHPDQRLTRSTVADLAETLATERSDLAGIILYGPLAEGD